MGQSIQMIVSWFIFYFQITANIYETAAAVSSCHGRLHGNSGTFTSPNYPNPPGPPSETNIASYPDNLGLITCEWQIEVPAGNGIQLKFGDFDMEAKLDDCDKGEVAVFSGIDKQKTILDEYCPGNNPDTVTLFGNTATVVFRRPTSFTGRGFLISYIAISPGKTIDDFVTCSDVGQAHVNVKSFSVMCPSGCASIEQHGVWGSLFYRDNSHLCRAAVHAGLISDSFGGRVKVRRKLGDVLYYGSNANDVIAQTGAMSDSQIDFPDLLVCHDEIRITEKQFSASSFWNTTDNSNRVQLWLPSKALLTVLSEAWSPDNFTKKQWLQVDLGKVMNVTGIVTRGSSKPYSYTKSFTVKYSSNNITWHSYKEKEQTKAKIFTGNTNFFGRVRNNFVEPSILARHIRVYPTAVPFDDDQHLRYGLKLGLLGCDIQPTVGPSSSTTMTPKTTKKTTTLPTSTSSTTTFSSTNAFEQSSKEGNDVQATAQTDIKNIASSVTNVTKPSNSTMLILDDYDQDQVHPISFNPGVETADMSDRSILVIVIVSALAVIAIFLAVLVLILVRKRKKYPKIETDIPRPTLQSNVAYDARIGLIYRNLNNNDVNMSPDQHGNGLPSRNSTFSNSKLNRPAPNGVSRQNSSINSRGGVTLQYDQQQTQPLLNGDALFRKGSIGQTRISFSTSSDVPDHRALHDKALGSFMPDDEDHEYQVILDPAEDSLKVSSKASTVSSDGAHSKASDSRSLHQGTMWGTAGDAWSNGVSSENGHMSSFASQNQAPTSFEPSNQMRFSTADKSVDPIVSHERRSPPSSQANWSGLRSSQQNRGNSPIRSSSTRLGNSFNRNSSSSGGSSFPPPEPMSAPLYNNCASVSEGHGNRITNSDLHSLHQANSFSQPSQHARKASYNIPSNIPLESSSPDADPTTHRDSDQSTTFPNGSSNPSMFGRSISKSKSLNQPKRHNEYDHLYRNKAATKPEGDRCVVAMGPNNYNTLDLNTNV